MSNVSPVDNKRTPVVEAKIDGQEFLCVVDTGASISLVSKEKWESCFPNHLPLAAEIVAETAINTPMGILGKIFLTVQVGSSEKEHEFYIVESLGSDVILGLDWILSNKGIIDLNEQMLKFPDGTTEPILLQNLGLSSKMIVVLQEDVEVPGRHEVVRRAMLKNPCVSECILEPNFDLMNKGVMVARALVKPLQQTVPVHIINPGHLPIKLHKGQTVGQLQGIEMEREDPVLSYDGGSDEFEFDLCHLLPEQQTKMKEFLWHNKSIFARNINELGTTTKAEHLIDTGGSHPIKQLPRRLPNVLREEVNRQVGEMLDSGVIRPSKSPWASPIVLVKKKDGTWRFCVDFRKLNDVTVKDSFPLPQINDLLDTLAGQRYFTTLDLASGYWQVSMENSSIEKTAFVIPGGGQFEFTKMAFGLTNAVPTFQRLMSNVLAGLLNNKCLVYIDDVLVVGKDFEEHMENSKEVFHAISNAGLKLKPSKCFFAKSSVKFLGFEISDKGLLPDEEKVKAIHDYAAPTDETSLRRFLGLASCYRRFVSGFSEIAAPLHRLLQKGSKFCWTKECDAAFEQLKAELQSSPLLGFPFLDKEFILCTDASDAGVGAILSQKDDNGKEFVISFASKAFSGAEKRWTTMEKEAFAVVWGLQYFHAYVYGQKVVVFTDHKALQWLRNLKSPNGKIARWLLKLEQYDYVVAHKPGSQMVHADALSRAPVDFVRIEMLNEAEISVLQVEDPDIGVALRWIQDNDKEALLPDDASESLQVLYNIRKTMFVINNVLYREWRGSDGIRRLQVVLPLKLRKEILEKAHANVGHMSTAKTFGVIQSNYYWPGFYADVDEFCKSCDICHRTKVVPRPRWPMQPLPVIPIPFYMVGVDIVGPLKCTRQGNKYILVAIDYYTKYTEAIAMKNQEAETVVRALEDIFSRHGLPGVLLTDQGANFQSKLVKSMCQMFNIDQRRTTAYHPQTNGLCERFNQTLKALLRARVNKDQDNWDEELPNVLLSYRIAKQETTGISPFELLYGRQARLSFSACPSDGLSIPTHGPGKYLENLRVRQEELRTAVSTRLEKAQERQKRGYDTRYKSVKADEFQVGDLVLLRDHRARGLSQKYKGPFQIVKVMNGTYEIQSLHDNKCKIVNHNALKYYNVDLQVEERVEVERKLDQDSEDDSEYEDLLFDSIEETERPINFAENPEPENRRYNLRRNRTQPDRYGIPVYDY